MGEKVCISSWRVLRLQQQIQTLFKALRLNFAANSFFTGENDLWLCKHWLEYDLAALAFLVIGMAAVGLIALIF